MKVSIIIRTYNNERSIKRAVESALLQNFPKKDYEVIVINDGSTDRTQNILRKYQNKIILINQQNQGAIAAANRSFKIARGKYVITLDSDDYFAKNLLSEMIKVFDQNPRINFVYSDYYEKSKAGKTKIFRIKNIFQTLACATMYRKKDLTKEGLWKKIKFPEYEILLRTLGRWK